MKPDEVIKKLLKLGWVKKEGAGHTKMYSPDGKIMVTVPRHKVDIKKGTLNRIKKVTGVDF